MAKDYHIEGNQIISNSLNTPIGEIKPDGRAEGPHPWNDDEIIVAADADSLRAAQRQLAEDDF